MLELKRKHGIDVQGANNDVLKGIKAVSNLMGSGHLKVHERCEGLIDDFYSYVWDDKQQEKGQDKPVKKSDHFADALRYAILTKFSYWKSMVYSNELRGVKQIDPLRGIQVL